MGYDEKISIGIIPLHCNRHNRVHNIGGYLDMPIGSKSHSNSEFELIENKLSQVHGN